MALSVRSLELPSDDRARRNPACTDAVERTNNYRFITGGVAVTLGDYTGQATICRKAADIHLGKPCLKREAGLIPGRYAVVFEQHADVVDEDGGDGTTFRKDAMSQRGYADSLLEESANGGCSAAVRHLAEIDTPDARPRALALFRKAAENGDRSAAARAALMQWEGTKDQGDHSTSLGRIEKPLGLL